MKAPAIAAVQRLTRSARKGDPEAVAALRDVALQAIAALESLTNIPPDHPEIPEAIRKGVAAAHDAAAHSLRWPVVWDAIQEIREPHLGKIHKDKKTDGTGRIGQRGIGSKAGIRLDRPTRGRPRDFSPEGQTGFALDAWLELDPIRGKKEHLHAADLHPDLAAPGVLTDDLLKRDWRNLAAMLQPLSADSLDAWTKAAFELCRDDCSSIEIDDHPGIPNVKRIRRNAEWEAFPWSDCVKTRAAGKYGESKKTLGAENSVKVKLRAGLAALVP